jgi:hypothetical protein
VEERVLAICKNDRRILSNVTELWPFFTVFELSLLHEQKMFFLAIQEESDSPSTYRWGAPKNLGKPETVRLMK